MSIVILSGLVVGAMLAGSGLNDDSQASDTPVDALLACQSIEAENVRLTCLDARLADFANALEDGRLSVTQTEVTQQVARSNFGLPLPRFGRGSRDSSSDAEAVVEAQTETLEDGSTVAYTPDGDVIEMTNITVEDIAESSSGRMVIFLSNGQIWRESNLGSARFPTGHEMNGLTADIRSGFLGGYRMTLSHARGAFRVRRVN